MRAIGNFLWFILGGVLMGLAWWFVGLVAFVTVVGIPWGKACFITIIGIPFGIQHLKLAGIALAPIGKTIVTKEVAAAARKTNAEAAVAALRSDK
jgi:uncharacterized membrane protein YccF (DUF307 family)